MSSVTLNVRVNDPLGDFVTANVGAAGLYENVSEFVRDLIRKDKERAESESLEHLKAELTSAFAALEQTYQALSADDVIARNRLRPDA